MATSCSSRPQTDKESPATKRPASARLPPGPKGRIRNLIQRLRGYSRLLTRLHEEYGDIVYFELPGAGFCVVYSPALIEEVLVTRESEFPTIDFASQSDLVEFTPLTSQNGESHRLRYPLMESAFAGDRMVPYSEIILREALRLREKCRPDTVVDIQEELANYAWACIIGSYLGRDVDFPYSIGKQVVAYLRLHMMLQFLPGTRLLASLPLPTLMKGERASKALDDLIYAAIRRAREEPSHDGHDVVSHFVRAGEQGSADWTFANDRAIRDEVLVLCGYVDGPIGALTLAVYYLGMNPSVRGRLEQEVDEVVGGRSIDVADFDRLTYTKAFCRELLRVDPPTYVSLPKVTAEDVVLGGYFIPKGTLMHSAPKVVGRRAEYWDKPDEFRPERWLDDPRAGCPPCPAHSYVPFGSGPHTCIGGGLATRMIVYGVATLAQHLRLDPHGDRIPEVSNVGATVLGRTPVAVKRRQ